MFWVSHMSQNSGPGRGPQERLQPPSGCLVEGKGRTDAWRGTAFGGQAHLAPCVLVQQ